MIWSHQEDLPVGCTIVGDPQHDCINLAKVLHFRASDKENLMGRSRRKQCTAWQPQITRCPSTTSPIHRVAMAQVGRTPCLSLSDSFPRRLLPCWGVHASIHGPNGKTSSNIPQKVLYKKAKNFLTLPRVQRMQSLGCLPSKGFHQDGPWGGSPNASEPTCIQLASLSDSKVRRNFERRFGVSCVGTSMAKKACARIETYRGRTMYPNIRRG